MHIYITPVTKILRCLSRSLQLYQNLAFISIMCMF